MTANSNISKSPRSKLQALYLHLSQEAIAVLPRSAHSFYFKDEIGNISTSRIRFTEKNVVAVLEPRFPLQKGWRTVFTFGKP